MAIDPITGLQGNSASSKNIEAFPESEGWEDFSSSDDKDLYKGYEDFSKKPLTSEGTDYEPLNDYFSNNNPNQLDFSDDIIYKSGEGYIDRLKLVQDRIGADRLYDGALEDVARAQSSGEQLRNATLRLLPNIAASIIGDAASIVDVGDYYNQDLEIGNDITRSMEEFKQKVNEEWFPIYRERPGESMDMGDPAWWFENISGLVESAASFAFTGGVIGKGLSALKWVNSLRKATGMGLKAATRLEGVTNALVSSTALNQAEAMRGAISIYDDVYKRALAVNNGDEILARTKAAEAAAHSININRLNIALNMTSASRFMKNPTIVSEAAKKISMKNTAKAMVTEGIQEYAEENVNLVAEKEGKELGNALIEGRDYKGSYKRVYNTIVSKEGFEAGFWGFWGGALQTGATEGIVNNMKIHNRDVKDSEGNTLYSKTGPKAYVDENLVEQLKERSSSGENLTEEDIDKAVSEFNSESDPRFSISEDGSARLKKAFIEGTEAVESLSKNEVQKERVSRNQLKKEHYETQKKFVDERIAELKKRGQSLFDTVEHGEEMERYHLRIDALNQLADPETIYDPIKREAMLDVLIDDAMKIEDEAKRKEQLTFLEQLVGADTKKIQELKNQQEGVLLSQQVYDFAKRGAVPELEAMYKSISEMTEDEAVKKGYSEDYVEKANKALELIKTYNEIDDKNRGLYGPIVEKALFDNRVKHRELATDYNKAKEVERTALEQQAKDPEGPEIMDVSEVPMSDDEILKAKQNVKKAKKAIDDSNDAYNKLKTKEGSASYSASHYKKMFKELSEAKKQINFRSAADDLIRLQNEDKAIFKLNDKEGVLTKEGDKYLFANEDEVVEITADNMFDLKDQIVSKEAYENAKKRKDELKRLEEKTKVFNKFKEELEADIEEIQNMINEKTENIDNINKKLQKTRENLNKLRLDKHNLYKQEPVPYGNFTYLVRKDGTVINVENDTVISPSPLANRIYKEFMSTSEEYLESYNQMINKVLEEIEEMEVQLEIINEETAKLNKKEEAMYGTLVLLDNKQKILDQGKREFAEQWEDAEEELRNDTEIKDLNKKLIEYSEARKNLEADIKDLNDLLEEVKLGFEELKDLTPEDVIGMLAEAQNQLKRLDNTVRKMKARKQDLTKYAKLFKALSKFNAKLAEAAAKEETKEKKKDSGPNPTNITADQRSNTNSGKFSYSNGDIDIDQLEYDAIMRKLNAFTSAGDHNGSIASGDENSLRWFEALNKIEDAESYFVEFITFDKTQELAGATQNIDRDVSESEFNDWTATGEFTDERVNIMARKLAIDKPLSEKEISMRRQDDDLKKSVENKEKEYRRYNEVFSQKNKDYEAEFGGNGIRMILVNKDGNMVTSDKYGNIDKGDLPLSMTMHSVEGERNKVAYKGEDGNWYSDFSVKHLIQNKVLNSRGNMFDLSVIEFAIGLEKANPKGNRLPKEYKELTGQELVNKILSEVHEDIQNTRDDIKDRIGEGERVFSAVTEISGGHAVYEKDIDNKKVQKDIVGTFVESIEDIASMTTNSRGEVVITDRSGRSLAVTPDTLSDEDTDIVLRLLNDSLKTRKVKGKDGKTRNVIGGDLQIFDGYDKKTKKERKTNRPIFFSNQLDKNYITDKDGNKVLLNPKPAEIENYIYWGKAKEGKSDKYQIYFDKEAKAVFYGENGVVAFDEILTDSDFRAFLKTKRYNFNRRMQRISSDEYENNPKKPFKIIGFTKKSEGKEKRKLMLKPTYGEKNLSGYELFILSKLKTNLADSSEGNPNFRQRYITFDSEISAVPKRKKPADIQRTAQQQQKPPSNTASSGLKKGEKILTTNEDDASTTDEDKVFGTKQETDSGYGTEPSNPEAAMKDLQEGILKAKREAALKKAALKKAGDTPTINVEEESDDEDGDEGVPFRLAGEYEKELSFFIDDNRQKLSEKGLPLLPSYYAQQFIKSGLAIEPYLDMLEESLDC